MPWRCSAAGGATSAGNHRPPEPPRSIARWPMRERPLVWLLMGTRAGDNNQLLALAEALDWPFEARHVDFNQLRRFPPFRKGLAIVARRSRELISPPWPDLVIGVGYGSVPVARHIREQS